MAHFLPPELVRQVNKLEWPNAHLTETGGNYQFTMNLNLVNSIEFLPHIMHFVNTQNSSRDTGPSRN